MQQTAIFGPFFAMVGLTFAVWVYMFARRIHFLTANDITPEELRVPGALAEKSPAEISNPSDNLKNLFEIPVLFYAIVLMLFATEQVDGLHLVCGWVFVAFRAVHSAIHCSFNHVMMRFYAYLVATLAVWLMAARAAWSTLAG
ncbi:MAG: MAPEG family protein [Myxococcota bacterium]|nr:MAPEG family protein [Myxococcota bacterium]